MNYRDSTIQILERTALTIPERGRHPESLDPLPGSYPSIQPFASRSAFVGEDPGTIGLPSEDMSKASKAVNEPLAAPRVLIVDDEPAILEILEALLEDNFECRTSHSGEDALRLICEESFAVVISDIRMSGMSGLELIVRTKEISPDTVGMLISGDVSIDTPIEAIRSGVFDYIRKPFKTDHVRAAVEMAAAHSSLLAAKRRFENDLHQLVEETTTRLNFLDYHDELTSLPNRRFLKKKLNESIDLAGPSSSAAVIFLSLDRYRNISDALGQTVGDRLLVEVGRRLSFLAENDGILARFEGGEFGAIRSYATSEELSAVVDRISTTFETPFDIGNGEKIASVSIGISRYPIDAVDSEALLKNAGAALSTARAKDSQVPEYFSAEIQEKAVRRSALENDLNPAIERGEFKLEYQPKIDFKTEQITGVEALIRWDHPTFGRISPGDFIPIAEETGAIVPIGEWVLRTACDQGKKWADIGFPVSIAVNLSAYQFRQKDAAERIVSILAKSGYEPRLLNLEVTESAIIDNLESAVETLNSLRGHGIAISIDDFGTGYSSLGYLKRLPVDCLKIDRSFITDVTNNPNDASLVHAIINIAHDLRLKVIAEGIETEEQHKFIHLLQCDEWQGYLFSKAVPSGVIEAFLRDQMLCETGERSNYLEFLIPDQSSAASV